MSDPDAQIYHSFVTGTVHRTLEDPVTMVIYDLTNQAVPLLHRYHTSPAIVSLQRIAMLGVFVYLLDRQMYREATVVYGLVYMVGCLATQMARGTGHADHTNHMDRIYWFKNTNQAVDWLAVFIGIIGIIASNPSKNTTYPIVGLLVFLLGLSTTHTTCQARYLESIQMDRGQTQTRLSGIMCPAWFVHNDELEDTMEITRFVGTGIYHMFVCAMLWNIPRFRSL
jgi:hypothetical protein